MCDTLFVGDGSGPYKEIENCGDLREFLKAESLVLADHYQPSDDECLCNVDLKATLASHGYPESAIKRDEDFMGWYFNPQKA